VSGLGFIRLIVCNFVDGSPIENFVDDSPVGVVDDSPVGVVNDRSARISPDRKFDNYEIS
jgi:hypothetical protein